MSIPDIEQYLLDNPINRSDNNPYSAPALLLSVDKEQVRRAWRNLRKRGLVEQSTSPFCTTSTLNKNVTNFSSTSTTPPDYTYQSNGNQATLSSTVKKEIKNELDLAEECDIDLSEWYIVKWTCKRYEAWIKNKAGEIEAQPKFSVYAEMKRKEVDKDLPTQKEQLLKELFESAPELQIFDMYPESDDSEVKDSLYEISLPDLHISKLSWAEEVGEDFDLKIVCERYETAITELLSRTNLSRVERILLPIGNDFINIDSAANMTTAGTPQSVDGRFPKIIRVAKDLLIKNITRLSVIAPVDVVVVPGNHDYHTMFLLGEILEAYFNNTERITIYNSPKSRKYYRYGNTGMQFTHGNEEKHGELGLIFATEEPALWASVKYRVAKLGHHHKTKKTNWVSVDEHQGFQVEVLPSLSATDSWHYKKGYMSQKAAKAFLYHVEKGKIGEFTYIL